MSGTGSPSSHARMRGRLPTQVKLTRVERLIFARPTLSYLRSRAGRARSDRLGATWACHMAVAMVLFAFWIPLAIAGIAVESTSPLAALVLELLAIPLACWSLVRCTTAYVASRRTSG